MAGSAAEGARSAVVDLMAIQVRIIAQHLDEQPSGDAAERQRRGRPRQIGERGKAGKFSRPGDRRRHRRRRKQRPGAVQKRPPAPPRDQRPERTGKVQPEAPRAHRQLVTGDPKRSLRPLVADPRRATVDDAGGSGEDGMVDRDRRREQRQRPGNRPDRERKRRARPLLHVTIVPRTRRSG